MNLNDSNYKFVKIIEPIRSYYKTFKTIDEFNNWYLKNKSGVDEYSTHKLNKMYNVEGYRITRIKGSLCLKKVIPKVIPKHNDETSETCDETSNERSSIQMHEQIISMKNEIQSLKKSIKEIIDYLNNNAGNVENNNI